MPQPDVADVHVNALLTNMSIAHRNKDDFYIADRVFPLVPVEKQTDIYPVFNRGYFFADEGDAMVRAPGTRAASTGYAVNLTNTYRCVNYAIGADIPDELRANADNPINLDQAATYLVSDIQKIRRERAWAAQFMITGVWTGQADQTGGSNFTKWSDYAGSDPFTDLENGMDSIEAATGERPNRLTIGAIVWRRLKHHPDFVDRIKGGSTTGNPAMMTRQLLATMLEIEEVLVGRAVYRSSDEGASLTLARVLDDDALLTYTPSSPQLFTPSAGYTFYWRPLTGGGIEYMRSGRENRELTDWIESHSYFDQVAVEPLSGAFYTDCVD